MAFDDYIESEVAVAVAATAAIFSPRVRRMLRRGAVYGVAGALIAADAVSTTARGIGQGAQQAAASAQQSVRSAGDRAEEDSGEARPSESGS